MASTLNHLGPNWKFHWYKQSVGPGAIRVAMILNDHEAPTIALGEHTLELVTGGQADAVEQFVGMLKPA